MFWGAAHARTPRGPIACHGDGAISRRRGVFLCPPDWQVWFSFPRPCFLIMAEWFNNGSVIDHKQTIM